MTSGYQAYQSNSVFTATPEQLVVMLYDGALRFCRRALGAWANGDKPAATTAVGRVTAIVHELNATLDMEKGGEIAENLRSIYTFLSGYLVESVTSRTPRSSAARWSILMELREAFSQAARKTAAAA